MVEPNRRVKLAEDLAENWRSRLFIDCPEQSAATRNSIVQWLLGQDVERFERLTPAQMEIAQQAMDYRYRILRQRYLGISPERGYRNLTTRLSGLVTLRNKFRTWVSLSRDRQRAVVDVLQEVIQELLNSDRYMQKQITWIAQCTDDTRLRDALLLTSIEEYCLRPIRNQPLLVYRFVNFLRRSQRGGMTHIPEGDKVRLVSEEVTPGETYAPVSLLDHQALVDYQDEQAISEQQALWTVVKQELSSYLEQELGPTAVNWLHLYLKGQSQEAIARSLNLPIQEVHRLREEITSHAIGVFALKGQPELVASWLKISLRAHSLGLTPTQWQQFWENLTPRQRQLIELLKAEETIEEIAKNWNLKTHQVIDEWKKLYLVAQALRSGDAIPVQEADATVSYEVLLTAMPDSVPVSGKIEVTISLNPVSANKSNEYLLEVPSEEIANEDLVIFLTAPGFQFDSNNATSLPIELEPNKNISIRQFTQAANFRLTALRSGSAIITAELYQGETFKTNIETKVQVTGFDEASFLRTRITTQPRPVPQPDFILRVQTTWNETNSACRFHYQLRSFRFPSLFPGETTYHSESLSSRWIEQMRGLLGTTLENISDVLPEDGRSRLSSLGQYLFQHLLPTELQTDFRSLIPRDRTFTLLILADQDASLPWELLHDGQRFLSDRFIIGRWFWELNDTRPHEFPVGVINVAHYADVEQPELWTALLEPPGATPPLLLPEGVLSNLDSTEAMRGLHLIRYSQSSDATNRRNAPVTLDDTNNAQDIDRQMRPAKLNLRRNRPLVSLGYVRRDLPELTTLEQTWASAFIRAGCSAFTGSLWAVDPTVEAAFISGFYNRLWTGDSLGEAFHASRQLARAVAPDSLDWLAYVLFGDPMARPYRPVEGKGYAVVEPIGREIDDPLPPSVPVRFRLSLRRTPPVWHEERVIEVAENLTFENLQAHVKTFGLQVTPDSPITMNLAPTGNYLGWFTLVAPPEMAGNSALVQVFLMDGMLPIHSLMFSLNIENEGGD